MGRQFGSSVGRCRKFWRFNLKGNPRGLKLFLVWFDLPEETPKVRAWLSKYHAVEISISTWILPSISPDFSVWSVLVNLLPPDIGMTLIPLWPGLERIHSRGKNDLVQELKTLGLQPRSE